MSRIAVEAKVDPGLGLEAILQYLAPIRPLLLASEVDEVQINAGGRYVFTERRGVQQLEDVHLDPVGLLAALKRIAVESGQEIEPDSVGLDCRFAGGRLSAVFEPVSCEGISCTIRKFHSVRLTLADLVAGGTLTAELAHVLHQAVLDRKNILVSGATGSGKTVLSGALANLFPPEERILLIEQPRELQLKQPNVVCWEALASGPGGNPVTQRDLLKRALRAHPSRIIVGEIRGEEAAEVLMITNTGHRGTITTQHSSGCRDALERFCTLCLMAPDRWPWDALRRAIAGNIHVVVHMEQRPDRSRYVAEAVAVEGYDRATDSFLASPLLEPQI